MSATSIDRPQPDEYPEYAQKYVELVGSTPLQELEARAVSTRALLDSLTEEQGGHRYAPGKWSIKEVIGHVNDTERIFTYRALRFSRGDRTPLASFEQDNYVVSGSFDKRSLKDLAAEYSCVRAASLSLFQSFDQDAWLRRGVSNNKDVSVRALAYITAGHELHHIKILKEKYLQAI